MTNEERKQIFYDTKKVAYTKTTKLYKENDILDSANPIEIIWSENTVKTIFKLNGKIAALNFADPFRPGGLVEQGIKTQEEDLCRSSTLYNSLIKEENIIEFYDYNMRKFGSTDRIIYSENVLFFKDENCVSTPFPKWCDIITCAAPLPNENLSIKELKNRMRRIIQAAALNKNDYLILGKWGCGAFCGDWELYSEMWNEVIAELEGNNVRNTSNKQM